MKARPRGIENRVAEWLTAHFRVLGISAVERIPVLGRTGPDISINESRLAIDVKSRKVVPACFSPRNGISESSNGLLAVKLKDFLLLYSDVERSGPLLVSSRQVDGWLAHMKVWADKNDTIPAIVLHRPGGRVENSVFVIFASDRVKLKERYIQWQEDSSRTSPKSQSKELQLFSIR